MAKVQEIGPYSAYAIAVKYGYKGTEEEWVKEQEANRKAAEAAAAAAAQSAKDAAASASGVAQSGQQAVQSIKDAQTAAEQAIDTAKQQAVQAAQAEAEKAAASAGQAASSAAEAAQSATNAAAEVGKVQSAGTAAVQAVQQAQSTATEAVSDAQQSATQAVSQAQTAAVSAVQEAGTTQTSAVESAGTAAVSAVSNAKTEALSQISNAGTAQVSAVETAGADAVEDVNDAKTAALEEIDAANAALPSPTQADAGKAPTVKTDGSAYELAGPYAPLSAAIRPTASGNPVSITDSVEWPLLGLKVYGKSTQDGTPSPENPVPIVNAGDDGSVGVNVTGKNVLNLNYAEAVGFNVAIDFENTVLRPNTQYTYTLYKTTGDISFALFLANNKDSGQATEQLQLTGYLSAGASKSFVTPNDLSKYTHLLLTGGAPGISSSNIKDLQVQLEVGPTATPYEPYKGLQSLTISTPTGLPGIPVDSDGNYTDVKGRQWASNSRDFDTNQCIEMIGIKQPVDAVYNSDESTNELLRFYVYVYDSSLNGTQESAYRFVLCDIVEVVSQFTERDHDVPVMAPYGHKDWLELRFWFPKSQYTPETAKEVLSRGHVLYPLATPIKTPLSEEEIAAYRTLHTYDGATVVSTAEEVAGIEVHYVADGEKYIDRKISEAIASAAETKLAAYDTLSGAIHEGVNEA